MRTTITAPLLNAVVPGAGLWYLGRRPRALINFLLAAVITALASASGSESVHYVFLAIMAGSAGYAHAVAAADRDDRMVGAD